MRSILASIICVGLINLVKAADPHWGQGCAYIDQTRQIYCFGGEPFSANDKQIPVYSFNVTNNSVLDLSNPQWTIIPSAPGGVTPSASSQFISAGIPGTDTVFIQGGMVCSSCTSNPAFSYSASTNKWTQLNTANPVMDAPSVIVDNTVYYFGGQTTSATGSTTTGVLLYNTMLSVNAKTGINTPIFVKGGTQLPQATWAASMVFSPAFGSVIIIGGQQYSGTTNIPVAMNDIIAINPTTGSYTKWNQTISTTGTLPATRWGHSTVMDANNTNAIMFGGCNDAGEAMNDVWLYNINKRAWSPQKTTGTPPSARCRHSAIIIGKYMFILFGGRNGVFGPDLNVALDINTWTWTTAPVFGTPPVPSASPSASSTHSSSVSKPSSSQTSTGGTETQDSSGISGGAIAGIVVGSIAGVGIIGALLFFFVFKKRNRYSNTNDHGDEEFPKGGVATNGMNTDKYPQGEYGRTPKFEDNATKPDNIIGGPALAPGRIMLEPVKPDGE